MTESYKPVCNDPTLEARVALLEQQVAQLQQAAAGVLVCPTCGGAGVVGDGMIPTYCTTCGGYGTIGGRP